MSGSSGEVRGKERHFTHTLKLRVALTSSPGTADKAKLKSLLYSDLSRGLVFCKRVPKKGNGPLCHRWRLSVSPQTTECLREGGRQTHIHRIASLLSDNRNCDCFNKNEAHSNII